MLTSRKWIKDYLTFNRKDRIGLICLIFVIGTSIFAPGLLSKNPKPLAIKQDAVLLLAVDTLQQRQMAKQNYRRQEHDYNDENNSAYQYEPSQTKSFVTGELFQFNPNTISFNDWQRLGLNERTSKTILKYVSKGGKFYKPEDLLKIWGMPEGFYQRVKDYVMIATVTKNYPQNNYNKPNFEREEKKVSLININSADTAAFIALPGIGSKLSARIINFRDKLGGFYSVEQIGETYGLPDSTFQKIKSRLQANANAVKKMNVNTATKDELKAHPYIRWNLANAIVEYRNQHGEFTSLDELKNIALVDEATFNKIVNYLAL